MECGSKETGKLKVVTCAIRFLRNRHVTSIKRNAEEESQKLCEGHYHAMFERFHLCSLPENTIVYDIPCSPCTSQVLIITQIINNNQWLRLNSKMKLWENRADKVSSWGCRVQLNNMIIENGWNKCKSPKQNKTISINKRNERWNSKITEALLFMK